MPKASDEQRFRSALAAGAKRDYPTAIELLLALLAEGKAPPEALLYLGRSYHALGNSGRSIESFRRYLREGGEPGLGFFFLGRAYLAARLPAAAASALRLSLESEPKRAASWALLGAAQLRLKRSRAALECLERAVALAPGDGRVFRGYLNALFVRAVRLLSQGDAETSRQALGFLIENGLDGPAARLWRARALKELGRFEEALADCREARRSAPADPSLSWLELGLLLSAGRGREAMAMYQSLRRAQPELPELPSEEAGLGRIKASLDFKDGRWKEAAGEALALLRVSPADPALRALAAESLRALGQLERARNHWERAIEADPRSPDFRLGLALVLWDLGDYRAALEAVEAARRLGAEPGEIDYYAALCRSRLGEDPERLLPLLQNLLRSRTRAGAEADPRLMFALGEVLYRSERPDLARTWFEKVLELVPDHELSLLYLISTAESLGEEAELRSAYGAYLAAYPDNAEIRRDYLELLAAAKAWAELVPVLEAGLAYAEPGQGSRRLLARAYRELGRFREAALLYRDLLAAEPASEELLLALALCLEREGRPEYALALLEKAPAAAKKGAGPWIVMGILAARKGRTEAAIDALRKACELAPGQGRPWRELARVYASKGLSQFAAEAEREAGRLEAAAAARGAAAAGGPQAAGKPSAATSPSKS